MTREKKKNKKRGSIFLLVLIFIFAGVMVFCGYKLWEIWSEYHANAKTQEEVQNLFYQDAMSGAAGSEELAEGYSFTFDLTPVIAQNPDTVGWIIVPNTVIDYAVVQGVDNDEYIHKGFFGEYNSAGTVFMDASNDVHGVMQNLILYGHRMKDGSMFGELGKFLEQSFYEENPTFIFITEDAIYDCDIFSVYQCTTEVDYCQYAFTNWDNMNSYVEAAKARSSIRTADVEVTAIDTLITLSTCDYLLDPDEGRLVVHAKLRKRTNG